MRKRDKAMNFVNKDKMVTGTTKAISNQIGIKPMYLRGGLVALSVIANPFVGVAAYGAAFAYKKLKK